MAPTSDGSTAICASNDSRPYHPIGTYHGHWEDFENILACHPQRSTRYSETYNNCQHFVAWFIILLEVLATQDARQLYRNPDQLDRCERICSVLEMGKGVLWNKPNPFVFARNMLPASGGAAAAVVAGAAAEAVVVEVVTVPVAGILGWFGATTTSAVLVPAAYAGIAALAAPVAMVGAVAAGAYAYRYASNWKEKSTFNDPRETGFPTEYCSAIGWAELQAGGHPQGPMWKSASLTFSASSISKSSIGSNGSLGQLAVGTLYVNENLVHAIVGL